MSIALLLAPLLLAQATDNIDGPMVSPGAAPSLNLPEIDRPNGPNRRTQSIAPVSPTLPPTPEGNRLSSCLAQAGSDADSALDRADAWLKAEKGPARAAPGMCLGTAYATLEQWIPAQEAFTAARDAADPTDHRMRATLGTMAGNVALAGGSPVGALVVLDVAKTDATALHDNVLLGGIAVDRARALVMLQRPADAASALAEARTATPEDGATWLLSATLSRRMGQLAEAQAEIENAAKFAPTDPQVGLEAGVIAQLAGHTDAARHSWQSVVTADPDGAAGRAASNYLAEIANPAVAGPIAHTGH